MSRGESKKSIILLLRDEEMNPSAIAESISVDKSTVSRNLRELVRQGIVRLKVFHSDMRVKLYTLNPGIQSFKKILNIFKSDYENYDLLMNSNYGEKVVSELINGFQKLANQDVFWSMARKKLKENWKVRIILPEGIKLSLEDREFIETTLREGIEKAIEYARENYLRDLLTIVKRSYSSMQLLVALLDGKVDSKLHAMFKRGISVLGLGDTPATILKLIQDVPEIKVPPKEDSEHFVNFFVINFAMIGAALPEIPPEILQRELDFYWSTFLAIFLDPVNIELKRNLFTQENWKDVFKRSLEIKLAKRKFLGEYEYCSLSMTDPIVHLKRLVSFKLKVNEDRMEIMFDKKVAETLAKHLGIWWEKIIVELNPTANTKNSSHQS